jgi:uncharacterized lipoprotein
MQFETIIKFISILFLAVVVAGCASKPRDDYQWSKLGPALELPPGLTAPDYDESMAIPDVKSPAASSYSDDNCDCASEASKQQPDENSDDVDDRSSN